MIATIASSDSLPTNVDTLEQLEGLPEECLSQDPKRPLLWTDSYCGSNYQYALKPMFYSAGFVLILEMLDRFSYYGLENIQTPFLVGHYSDWNANRTAVEASSYVSGSAAVACTMPFVGGILADGILGDYWTIVVGTAIFYIPGLLLLALTTVPNLLGPTFSQSILKAGMIVLYPVGAGFLNAVLNVFGAKQYHPVLQADMIEAYFVNFFMAYNVGALAGGVALPLVAQVRITAAYAIPVGAMVLGLLTFVLGTFRYVKVTPRKDAQLKTLRVIGTPLACRPVDSTKKSKGGTLDDGFVDGVKSLLAVIPMAALTVPFNIAYSQIVSVFSVQGMTMRSAGFIDSAMMMNFDAVSVLICGTVVGGYLYPTLTKRHIRLAIAHKFAIGTVLGCTSILASIAVDMAIHRHPDKISILWQIPQYMIIGGGEIFTIATAFETAFVFAPPEHKSLAAALVLLMIGAVPNFVCVGLYNACAVWFPSGVNFIEYQGSHVYRYLWVLVGITAFGAALCVYPPVSRWVEDRHTRAVALQEADATAALAVGILNDDVEKQPSTRDLDGTDSTDGSDAKRTEPEMDVEDSEEDEPHP